MKKVGLPDKDGVVWGVREQNSTHVQTHLSSREKTTFYLICPACRYLWFKALSMEPGAGALPRGVFLIGLWLGWAGGLKALPMTCKGSAIALLFMHVAYCRHNQK